MPVNRPNIIQKAVLRAIIFRVSVGNGSVAIILLARRKAECGRPPKGMEAIQLPGMASSNSGAGFNFVLKLANRSKD